MTAHLDKLNAAEANPKLPSSDRAKLAHAKELYFKWIRDLEALQSSGDDLLRDMVRLTNEYKRFIEVDLIFDSSEDFLYRQKGQLKLDNSILEEFLPRLVDPRLVPGISAVEGFTSGPKQCFAGLYIGPIAQPLNEGGIFLKTKNQDFAVGRKLHIQASTEPHFVSRQMMSSEINIAHFVAEIKTNLDKTMFQEASATARELKANVRESLYYVLCEWLDMPPIDTRMTDIDRVVLLRKAKRLPSSTRAEFSSSAGRRRNRAEFVRHIESHPLQWSSFKIVLNALNEAFPTVGSLSESDVLSKGHF